jgi:hypothetical protein
MYELCHPAIGHVLLLLSECLGGASGPKPLTSRVQGALSQLVFFGPR